MKWYLQTALNILKAHAKEYLKVQDTNGHLPTEDELEYALQWVEYSFGKTQSDAIYYMLVYLDRWFTNVKTANVDPMLPSPMKLIDAFKHSLVLAVKITDDDEVRNDNLFFERDQIIEFNRLVGDINNYRDEKCALEELLTIVNEVIESGEKYYNQKKAGYEKLKAEHIKGKIEDSLLESDLRQKQKAYINEKNELSTFISTSIKEIQARETRYDKYIKEVNEDLEFLEDIYKHKDDIIYIGKIAELFNGWIEHYNQLIKESKDELKKLTRHLNNDKQDSDNLIEFNKREMQFYKLLQIEFVKVEDVLKILEKYSEKIDNEIEYYLHRYFVGQQEKCALVEYSHFFVKEIQRLVEDAESRTSAASSVTYRNIIEHLHITTKLPKSVPQIVEEKFHYQNPIAGGNKIEQRVITTRPAKSMSQIVEEKVQRQHPVAGQREYVTTIAKNENAIEQLDICRIVM